MIYKITVVLFWEKGQTNEIQFAYKYLLISETR